MSMRAVLRDVLQTATLVLLTATAAQAQQVTTALDIPDELAFELSDALIPVLPQTIAREQDGRLTTRAVRLDVPLLIDGRLDEALYESVNPISDFIQNEPVNDTAATERTEVWISFDESNVYVSVRAHESQPERMVVNEMRRDSRNIWQNENFAFMFDTFFDRRSGVAVNRVRLPYGDFTTKLYSSRVTYTVTPLMFVSGLMRYNSANTSLSTNVRLRWEYQPGSELFVVYDEGRNTLGSGLPDLQNRTVVIKINRLFRF